MTTFTFKNFEVRDFSSSNYSSHNKNVLGRLINTLVNAVNENNTLPKLIVIIVDDDIVRNMRHTNARQIHRVTSWLLTQYEHSILAYKDFLLTRAKKQTNHICCGLNHSNTKTSDITTISFVLQSVARQKLFMSTLQMIKIWEPNDNSSYLADANRFTSQGLVKYWASVDSAIRYWNVAIQPKVLFHQKRHNNLRAEKSFSRFHWHKNKFN